MRSFPITLLFTLHLFVGLSSAIRGERRQLQVLTQTKNGKEVKCRPLPKDYKDASSIPPLAGTTAGSATPSKIILSSESPSISPSNILLAKSSAPSVQLPFCTEPASKDSKGKIGAKADCAALAKGALPETYDNSVEGYLKVDVSYNGAPTKVLAQVGEVLSEASAAVAGCPEPVQLQNGTIPTFNATNDTAPVILGVNFTDFSIGSACTPLNKTLNCSEVTCNVTILYNGEANATERAAMLELLKTTVKSQVSRGAFASVGVQATSVEIGSEESTSRSGQPMSKSASRIANLVAVMAGVAAAIGLC